MQEELPIASTLTLMACGKPDEAFAKAKSGRSGMEGKFEKFNMLRETLKEKWVERVVLVESERRLNNAGRKCILS